jgi:hypothetical protein
MLRLTHLTSLGRAVLRLGLLPLLPALSVAMVACGDESSNAAPIIDSVDAPLVVNEHNGSYTIPVTVLFHDNDGEIITRLHYRLPPNIDGMIDVPAPNPDVESAQLTIVVPASQLDGTPASDVSTKGESQANDPHAAQAAAQAQDDRDHGRGADRNRARALELRIVDGRGAESLPLSSTVTLD